MERDRCMKFLKFEEFRAFARSTRAFGPFAYHIWDMRSVLAVGLVLCGAVSAQPRKTQNLVLVTADGLRWQEVFGGIDARLMHEKAAGMEKADDVRSELWAETAVQRREKLLPFFWKTIAARGVVLGNREKGSAVLVTNGFRVSYPGYSEILTCRAQDDKIRGNDPIRNPRQTVLEFLRQQWRLQPSQVALFASWERFREIGESREGSIFINAGYQEARGTPRMEDLGRLQLDLRTPWKEARHDAITFELALEYVKRYKPRVLYLALDETDDWAHDKRYDGVLRMAQYFDRALERLWTAMQAMPEYRDRTSLVVTSDHGRGSELADWSSHGSKVAGAEYIWLAVMGPDTPTRGEVANAQTVHQRDVSATLLALAGLESGEFCGDQGKPVALALP